MAAIRIYSGICRQCAGRALVELQEASRVDTLATEQDPEQDRCDGLLPIAYSVDLAPGDPLLGEEPASNVRRDPIVSLSGFIRADLIGQHSGV